MSYKHFGKLLLVLTATFLYTSPLAAKIYKVVDPETGRITFTDKPPSAEQKQPAKKVDLPEVNTQPATPVPEGTASEEEQTAFPGYQDFVISQPQDQATIPPGFESIQVQMHVAPALQEGHKIQLLYNSKKHGSPSATTQFTIGNLIRGAHNISADIVDESGKVVSSTPTITVHVKRGSRNF